MTASIAVGDTVVPATIRHLTANKILEESNLLKSLFRSLEHHSIVDQDCEKGENVRNSLLPLGGLILGGNTYLLGDVAIDSTGS